jgi:iron complex transport system substrate-binding protein
MKIERRSLLAGLSATLLAPRLARAASVTDSVGRTITIPDKIERVFAAGPPAAILLYTFAPELLLGWTRSLEPAQCEFLGAGACDKPEVGRLTGRGNTTNLEVLLKLKPDLVLDFGTVNDTYISLADKVQEQTGIPYALLDGRFDASAAIYRKLGELTKRPREADEFARYADRIVTTVKGRVDKIPAANQPRVYYARGPRGLETGLGGSINVETIEFLGARNVAAERKGGMATVSMEQVLAWNPDVIITRVGAGEGGADRAGLFVAEHAVRLGGFSAVGQPADRTVVARQGSLSRSLPGGSAADHTRVLSAFLSRDADRRADRPHTGGKNLMPLRGGISLLWIAG